MSHAADTIQQILTECRIVAVVGLSSNTERPSYEVAEYLQKNGYRIIPVNPSHAGSNLLGELCHASLRDAADALALEGEKIEIVDCFRRSDMIEPIADEAIAIGARCLWMQLGVVNERAAEKARHAGLAVVSDHCMKIEHTYLN
jgi:predicted CoA-binding protein